VKHEVTKREIAKHLGFGPMVTTDSYMESRAINKGMSLLGGWKLRLFGETIVDLKMKTCILENICKLNLCVKMQMDQLCNTTLIGFTHSRFI
jgi:hypothetical protein